MSAESRVGGRIARETHSILRHPKWPHVSNAIAVGDRDVALRIVQVQKVARALVDHTFIPVEHLVGAGVHAVVDDASLRIPQLRTVLQTNSIAFADTAVATPSIEDAFVALLGDESRQQ